MIQAGTTVYTYDAENHRIGVNGTRFVVNSQPALSQVLVKTAADGAQTFYVYGLGLIGEESVAGYKTYHFDYRGSTVALSDESGAVSARFGYSAYGVLLSGDTSQTPFLFNGMYGVMTDGNGPYHMRARFYNAEIRRFLNRDVLVGGVAEGQSLNRFGFVTGKPVRFIDPFGLEEFEPGSLTDMIPIYGPRNLAVYYFGNGEAGWGIFYTAVAVSDVFLIRAIVTSGIKYCASEAIIGRSVGAAFARVTPGGRTLTEHALESLERHGFKNLSQVDDIINNYTKVTDQADGAIVYIQKNFRGRYDIIIEGLEGITTGMLNLSRHELNNLARNYGWGSF